jgi:hypothetical protein
MVKTRTAQVFKLTRGAKLKNYIQFKCSLSYQRAEKTKGLPCGCEQEE